MRRVGRVLFGAVVVALLCLLVLKAAFLGFAWNQQLRAERVLAAVRSLQPGVSTAADVQRVVVSKNLGFSSPCETDHSEEGQGEVNIYNVGMGLPHVLRRLLQPRWTMFEVSLRCSTGTLTQLKVVEMQDVEGWPHPYSNSTTIVDVWKPNDPYRPVPASQLHYSVYESTTGLYVGDRLVKEAPPLMRFIQMDRYATPDERSKALNFRLDCFTRLRGCQDVNLILQPSPNP